MFTRRASSGLARLGRKIFHKEGLEDSLLKKESPMRVYSRAGAIDKNGILGKRVSDTLTKKQSWANSPVCWEQ